MAKQYDIKVHVDLSQSDAALARQSQGIGKVERQYKQAGDAQERAAKRAADQQVRQAERAAQAQAKASQRAADQQARDAQRIANAQAKEAEKAANAQARAAERSANKNATEAQRAANAQTRAAQVAANAQIKEADRAANAQARSAKKAADAQAKEADRAFRSSFVSSLGLEAQASKLSDKLTDQATKQANAKISAADRAQARLSAMAGRALTDEEVKAKAIGAVNQRLNDKRVALATKTAEKERTAGLGAVDRFNEMASVLADKINPASIAWTAGLAGAGILLGDMVKRWHDIGEGIQTATKFQTKYRESLPENAALKGRLGDTTKESRDSLLTRSLTLQTADQAKEFEAAFLNTGQASIGPRFSQAEANRLKIEGGSFQAAEGGSATTHGELLGRLPALMKLPKDKAGKDIPLTADQVMAEESRIFDILQGGGASFTQGAGQLMKHASLSQTGGFKSIAEQTALQSAFSVGNKDQGGEMVAWLQRSTVGNLGRMTSSGIEGSEKVGEYLKGIKADQFTQSIPISKAISADLLRQEQQAKVARKEFSADKYLRSKGFGNEEDIKSQLAFHEMNQSGQLAPFLAKAEGPATPKAIQDKIAESRADPMMQARSADYARDAQQFTYARDHATADAFRRQVFYEAKKDNPILSGEFEDIEKDPTYKKQRLLQASVDKALQRSAGRAGIKVDSIGGYNPTASQLALDKPVQSAIDRIQAAKVDPFADSRTMLAGQVLENLNAASAAEVAPRAGLAKQAEEKRKARMLADPANQPVQRDGDAGLMMRGMPSSMLPGLGGIPGLPGDASLGVLQQILVMLQEQTAMQQDAARTRNAQEKHLADLAGKKPASMGPLPPTGPGRINPRP